MVLGGITFVYAHIFDFHSAFTLTFKDSVLAAAGSITLERV